MQSLSPSPILIFDGEEVLGKAVAKYLLTQFKIIYYSQKKSKKTSHSPTFFLTASLPKENLSAIIIVHNKKKKSQAVIKKLLQYAKKRQIQVIYLASLFHISPKDVATLSISYEHLYIFLYGEVMNISQEETTCSQMLTEAMISKKITLENGGLEKIYLTPFDLMCETIYKFLTKDLVLRRIFYLFPKTPPTKFAVAQEISRVVPAKLHFLKSKKRQFIFSFYNGYYLPFTYSLPSLLATQIEQMKDNEKETVQNKREQMPKGEKFLLIVLFFVISYVFFGGILGIALSNVGKRFYANEHYAVAEVSIKLSNIFLLGFRSSYALLPSPLKNLTSQNSKQNEYIHSAILAQDYPSSNEEYVSNLLLASKNKQELCLETYCSDEFTSTGILGLLTYKFLGYAGVRNYLVLVQNEQDLQPGGGDIFGYSILTLDKGTYIMHPFQKVTSLDSRLEQDLLPPLYQQLAYGTTTMYLRDSSYTESVTKNAEMATFLYNLESQKSIDGVIFLTLRGIKTLFSLPNQIYTEVIKSEPEKRLNIINSAIHPKGEFALYQNNMQDILRTKDLQLSFADKWEEEERVLLNQNNSYIPSEKKEQTIQDLVGVLEANVGRNDVNPYITRDISQEVTVKPNKEVSNLILHYENTSTEQTTNGGEYKAFFQVLLPKSAVITSIQINGIPQIIDDESITPDKTSQKNSLAVYKEERDNLISYGWFITVPVLERDELQITYEIPYGNNQKPEYYDLQLIKQAGIADIPYDLIFKTAGFTDQVPLRYETTISLIGDRRLQLALGGKMVKRLQ